MRVYLANLILAITHPLSSAAIGGLLLAWANIFTDFGPYLAFVLIGLGPASIHNIYLYLHSRQEQLKLDADELLYVFCYALLTVVMGSQLFASMRWMYIAMILAIFHGLNLIINKYFHKVNQRASQIALWTTILIDKVALLYTLGYLIIIPLFWVQLRRKKSNFVELIWAIVLGLAVGVLTWVY